MRTNAKNMALGGVMAALAVVIMALVGMIPASTYACPAVCMILLSVVRMFCGNRVAWAWYGAVAFLSLLMGPDKEAVFVFVFLGYYPILKPGMDRLPFRWLWKVLLFNTAVLIMYWLLLNLMGMAELAAEFNELGGLMLAVLLAMGNMIFFLLDRILERLQFKFSNKGRG